MQAGAVKGTSLLSPLPEGEGQGEGPATASPAIRNRGVTSSLLRRRQLRRSSSDAETALWYQLRDRRLAGFKFRRQQGWGPFILDFFCWEQRLAIELDGGQHYEAVTADYDARRTAYLQRQGIRVLRFTNDQVFKERRAVLAAIVRALGQERPSPSP